MIVGSLLLILVAVVLLGIGLARGSNTLLIGSIAASLFAAMALVVGARQAVANRVDERDELDDALGPEPAGEDFHREPARVPVAAGHTGAGPTGAGPTGAGPTGAGPTGAGPTGAGHTAGGRTGAALAEPAIPAQPGASAQAAVQTATQPPAQGAQAVQAPAEAEAGEPDDDEDPPDEPAPQLISAADAARVARMSIEVLVIDGRPRYHLAGCVHLLGRETEPLPVREAVELGFSPCSLCEPDSAILAEARRV